MALVDGSRELEDTERMADLSEQAALRQMEERLAKTYAEIPAERVTSAIHAAYREFDAVPIRDFVALFVERRARVELGNL